MSSFICSPKHFNSIQWALIRFFRNGLMGYDEAVALKEVAPELIIIRGGGGSVNEPAVKKFFDDLRYLNVLAVRYHYAEDGELLESGEPSEALAKRINEEWNYLVLHSEPERTENIPSLPAFHKALRCVNAQLDGMEYVTRERALTTDERHTFEVLQALLNIIADCVISALPQYLSAPWEIREQEAVPAQPAAAPAEAGRRLNGKDLQVGDIFEERNKAGEVEAVRKVTKVSKGTYKFVRFDTDQNYLGNGGGNLSAFNSLVHSGLLNFVDPELREHLSRRGDEVNEWKKVRAYEIV